MSTATDLVDEFLIGEKIVLEYRKADEAYAKALNKLSEHFLPQLYELIDDLPNCVCFEGRADIYKLLSQKFKFIGESITIAYALSYLGEKGFRAEFDKVTKSK